jgi:HD-GYP domain-containing protein (c-di-GMP phosphodiesterase class II)
VPKLKTVGARAETREVRIGLRERLLPVVTLGVLTALLPAAVLVAFGDVSVSLSAEVHFYSVGFSACAAAAAALGLTVVGARRSDTRTVLVGTAFAVMASLLALHGLSTPGVWFGNNGVVAITGGATLPAGAVLLTLSILPLPPFLQSIRSLLILEGLLLALVLGLGISALAWPSLLPAVPAPNSGAALGLLAVGLVAYALLILRASRTFLLTQRALDLVVVVGLVWLGTALVPALTMNYEQLGWWIGHEVELDGILLVGLAVAVDLARAAQSRPLAGDLRGADLVAAEDIFLGSHVRALTVRLADKDEYTERHTRRVALRAVQVGETLGLSASRLRTLAIGGLVHDIGKLSVPDAILKKPGPLDDDEYAVVQEHPERGYRLLTELGGFPASVRQLVRDHHERLDGAGYPRGLSGGEIDLDTRILTVCDVYDALISKRVYRAAWSHDDAMALLHRETGTAFDPRCVAALEQVIGSEQPAPLPVASVREPVPAGVA